MIERWLRSLLALVVSVLWLTPLLFTALIFRGWTYRSFSAWARTTLRILGVEVTYEQRAGLHYSGVVFVGLNQASLIDTLIWQAYIPRDALYVCNVEFTLIPLMGWLSVLLGYPVVIRQSASNRQALVPRCVEKLKAGHAICIEIEGKRSATGELGDYKRGPALMAIRAQVPMIPVIIKGTREILPYGSLLPKPGRVLFLLAHEVAETAQGLVDDQRVEITARLREIAERELQA